MMVDTMKSSTQVVAIRRRGDATANAGAPVRLQEGSEKLIDKTRQTNLLSPFLTQAGAVERVEIMIVSTVISAKAT